MNDDVRYVKFIDDSRILYVMTNGGRLYKFNVNNCFKPLHTYQNGEFMTNMYCISNKILLTASSNGNIIKINL